MNEEKIIVWERVRFKDDKPVSWERSLDKGETWETIHWPFGELPFVLFNPNPDVTEFVSVKWEQQ